MDKRMTKEELDKLELQLFDSLSSNRRKAAKIIQKYNIVELGDSLFRAYQKEKLDKRTWETQMEMINALGKINFKPALSIWEEIIAKNKRLDAITSAAALAYVRLMRKNNNDISPVLFLMKKGDLSVLNGAMKALDIDSMIPDKKEIEILIQEFDNIQHERLFESGCGDPRAKLLSAMSKWDKASTEEFIMRFLDSKDDDLNEHARLALKKKRHNKY